MDWESDRRVLESEDRRNEGGLRDICPLCGFDWSSETAHIRAGKGWGGSLSSEGLEVEYPQSQEDCCVRLVRRMAKFSDRQRVM